MGRRKFFEKYEVLYKYRMRTDLPGPLIEEPKKEWPKKKREEDFEEEHKYGIYFDDEYNYLQHLKSVRAEDEVCEGEKINKELMLPSVQEIDEDFIMEDEDVIAVENEDDFPDDFINHLQGECNSEELPEVCNNPKKNVLENITEENEDMDKIFEEEYFRDPYMMDKFISSMPSAGEKSESSKIDKINQPTNTIHFDPEEEYVDFDGNPISAYDFNAFMEKNYGNSNDDEIPEPPSSKFRHLKFEEAVTNDNDEDDDTMERTKDWILTYMNSDRADEMNEDDEAPSPRKKEFDVVSYHMQYSRTKPKQFFYDIDKELAERYPNSKHAKYYNTKLNKKNKSDDISDDDSEFNGVDSDIDDRKTILTQISTLSFRPKFESGDERKQRKMHLKECRRERKQQKKELKTVFTNARKSQKNIQNIRIKPL